MSSGYISDESLQRLVSVVLAADGITIHGIAQAIGLSLGYTKSILSKARAAGQIDCVQSAKHEYRWHSPAKAAAIISLQQAAAAERRRLAKRRSQEKQRGHDASDWYWRELGDKPQPSKVSAFAPLPFVCSAPSSVFAWRP